MNPLYLLTEDDIIFIEAASKEEALNALTSAALRKRPLIDERAFRAAIFEREAAISTAVGEGVAVPHAKMHSIAEFFITPAICNPPVDWGAIDDEPVSLAFLVGGPKDRQEDYMRALSAVVTMAWNKAVRKELLEAETPAAALAVIRSYLGIR